MVGATGIEPVTPYHVKVGALPLSYAPLSRD